MIGISHLSIHNYDLFNEFLRHDISPSRAGGGDLRAIF